MTEQEVARRISNLVVNDISARAKTLEDAVEGRLEAAFPARNAASFLALTIKGVLAGPLGKQVFELVDEWSKPGVSLDAFLKERGLVSVSDSDAIDAAVAEILAANADKVAAYKGGKEALFGFFVGQTMKAMGGKASPGVVNERLRAGLQA